jgi:hypothetical protein
MTILQVKHLGFMGFSHKYEAVSTFNAGTASNPFFDVTVPSPRRLSKAPGSGQVPGWF